MKSDKGFFEFIRRAITPRIALAIGAGMLLLLLAGQPLLQTESADFEDELAELCSSVGGVGRCRVMTTYGTDGDIEAVAILCDGAESDRVRSDLSRLISSLYGIGYHRISILKISK